MLLAGGANHGYQLKLDFEHATGEAWPLNVGQVYTTLQRLERDGLVAETTADADAAADERVVYALTGDGLKVVREWMTTPEQRPVPNRDEVAMKVLLATVSESVDALEVIDEQRRATMSNLQEYSRLRSNAGDDADDLPLLLQLDRLILLRQAELRWLDDVEERLEALKGRPKPARSASSEQADDTSLDDTPAAKTKEPT